MLSTGKGAAAAPGRGGAGTQSSGRGSPQSGEDRREGPGVQEWPDGSRYEGEFVDGFKHGKGKYTWESGECYEGSFYKDYRHGDGRYTCPTGHKFTGKFYLNRKEGYGQQVFPDGTTFHGLYHLDLRCGPGLVSYSDGRVDVGLWDRERLIRLCTSVEEGFSLKSFPEYAAYMDSLPQPPCGGLPSESRTNSKVDTDRDLLLDENFILPPGIESYSTDGDHLPLPPGRRRELDRCFFGGLWEPDAHGYQGYERDPLSTLPLQARMEAHIHKHRRLAENVGWDVAAVLSLNREGFGPKGPLEVMSELLIQHASRGELQAVSKILQTGLVHPDVVDSQGHSALMAATVNCHNHVIHLLLDVGADIDKLNREGMSALALCHVLYYPFQSLHNTFTEPPPRTQVLRSPPLCRNSPKVSVVDFTTNGLNKRPQTTNTTVSSQTGQSHVSDKTAEELTERNLQHSGELTDDSELIADRWSGLNEPETPTATEQPHEEEEDGRKEEEDTETDRDGQVREREEGRRREDEKESKEEEREIESRCDQMWENGEKDLNLLEKEDGELGDEGETQSRKQDEEVEEDVERKENDYQEDDLKEGGSEDVPGVERSIQVLDGHITLGSVQWRERRAKAAGGMQGKDKEKQTFDSARSVSSYNIQVTEEVMQRSAEALSRTGIPQSSDTQETVRKMAAMKTEHRVRLNTLKLLLERGADPNASRVPMPVLFLAIMAADTEAVRRLLLCGARTDIPLPPERKGLYPLHVAAALPGPAGPKITELLLHAVTDPDAQACDHDEIYEPDKISDKAQDKLSTSENPQLKEGGRTALHVACQRESDYENASKVVALLLSHRASTDLLWSGHSPLSLAIATGNDLAVEELLKGGANPNIPLGCRVGSALCALANVNYHLGGNREKLLDMLAKAGADIMMPITVGNISGTAVDYAYHSFNQDLRIANTPFHALNMRERETFKARQQLLRMMRDQLRQTAGRRERESLESQQHLSLSSQEGLPAITEKQRKPPFKFCYHCGRSVSVKLTSCSRCHKVYFCSKSCKLQAWDERHKDECVRESASAVGIQKSVVFKSQRGTRPLTAKSKSKTVAGPLSVKVKSKAAPTPSGVTLKSQRGPEPMSMAAKVLESHVNLKENYSHN